MCSFSYGESVNYTFLAVASVYNARCKCALFCLQSDYSIFFNAFYTLWFRLRINNIIFSGFLSVHSACPRYTIAHSKLNEWKEEKRNRIRCRFLCLSRCSWSPVSIAIRWFSASRMYWKRPTPIWCFAHSPIFPNCLMYQSYEFSCWSYVPKSNANKSSSCDSEKKKIVSNPVIGRRAIAAHDTINLFWILVHEKLE